MPIAMEREISTLWGLKLLRFLLINQHASAQIGSLFVQFLIGRKRSLATLDNSVLGLLNGTYRNIRFDAKHGKYGTVRLKRHSVQK